MYQKKSFSGVAFAGLFVLLCLHSAAVSAQEELSPEVEVNDELDALKEDAEKMLQDAQNLFFPSSSSSVNDKKRGICSCKGVKCNCCQFITSTAIGLKDNCCVKLTYLGGSKATYQYSLKIGSRTLFTREVPVKVPPKTLCVSLAYLRKGASACIKLYKLFVDQTQFKGCVWFTGRILKVPVKRTGLGCFKINITSATEQDVLPAEVPTVENNDAWEQPETSLSEVATDDEMDTLKEDFEEMLRDVQSLFFQSSSSSSSMTDEDRRGICNCTGVKCSCCRYIVSSFIKLRDNCCVKLTFMGVGKAQLTYSLKIGNRTLFNQVISVTTPPKKLCVSLSYLRKGASACIQLYNLFVDQTSYSGCVWFTGRLVYIPVRRTGLGCFKIRLMNTTELYDEPLELPAAGGENVLEEPEMPFLADSVPMENIQPLKDVAEDEAGNMLL